MVYYLTYIIEKNKVKELTDELKENYKQYICDKYQDILMYGIENATSLEIISTIIEWYDTLDYKAYSRKIDEYNSPLRVAIALNKFDFANLLLENKASIDYDLMDTYGYHKYLNNENLCYMIDIGYPFKVIKNFFFLMLKCPKNWVKIFENQEKNFIFTNSMSIHQWLEYLNIDKNNIN